MLSLFDDFIQSASDFIGCHDISVVTDSDWEAQDSYFFLSSCRVWHTLIWPRPIQAGHGNGYYSGWDIGDIFRGSCPSGHWPMQMPSSSPSRCSVSEVLLLYSTSLWIRNLNAFAGHLSQQHWQNTWKYFSFLAGLSQQLYRSISWSPLLDSSSMLSKTLWNVGSLMNKTRKKQCASYPLDEHKWSRPFWRSPV